MRTDVIEDWLNLSKIELFMFYQRRQLINDDSSVVIITHALCVLHLPRVGYQQIVRAASVVENSSFWLSRDFLCEKFRKRDFMLGD